MFNKLIKKIPIANIPIILCVILLVFTVYAIYFRATASSTGTRIGEGTGTMVGRAVGSLEGLTEGQAQGYADGRAAGLSAEDTTAELVGKIQEVQKLEVLVASGTYSDVLSVGEDYAALLSQKYNAIFTVDLSTADIELRSDGLHIILDLPHVEFIPIGDIIKVNEYQKFGFTGDAEAGYDALNNSANQIQEKATQKLTADASMMNAAKTSAETQLVSLVNAVSISKPKVFVEWRGQ